MRQRENQDIARGSFTNLPEVTNPEVANMLIAMMTTRDSVQTFVKMTNSFKNPSQDLSQGLAKDLHQKLHDDPAKSDLDPKYLEEFSEIEKDLELGDKLATDGLELVKREEEGNKEEGISQEEKKQEKEKQEELQSQKHRVFELVKDVMTRVRSGNYHDEFSFDSEITQEELEDLISKIDDHISSEASQAESQRLEFINRIIANANGLSMTQLLQLIHGVNENIDDISVIANISEAEISKIFDDFFGITDEEEYEYDSNYEPDIDESWQIDELLEDENREGEIDAEIEEGQIAHDARVKEMDELKDLTKELQQQSDELVQKAEIFSQKIDEQLQEVTELEKNTPELPDNLLQIIEESDVEDISLQESLQRVEEYSQMIKEFTTEQKEQINAELDKEVNLGGNSEELMLNLDVLEQWNEGLNEEVEVLRKEVAIKSEQSDILMKEVELDENTNEVLERMGLNNIKDDNVEVVADDVKTENEEESAISKASVFVAPQRESYDPPKEPVQEKGSMMSNLLDKLKSKVVNNESGVVGEITPLNNQESWEVKEVFPTPSREEVKKKEISIFEGLDSLKGKIADLQLESELPDVNNIDESEVLNEDYLEADDIVMDLAHDEDGNNIDFVEPDEPVIASSTQNLKDRFSKYRNENNIEVADEVTEPVVNSSIQSLKDRFNKYKESHNEPEKETGNDNNKYPTRTPSTSVEKPFIDIAISQHTR